MTNIHVPYDQQVRPYHKKIAQLVKKYTEGNSDLLDIGGGVGHLASKIRSICPLMKLTVADIDDVTLELTKTRVNNVITLKINDVSDLYEQDVQYDVIVLSHVLEHLTNPYDSLRGIYSILRKGGILIIAVPNPLELPVLFNSLRRKNYVNRGHAYAWDRSHWINFLENIVGYTVVEYTEDFVPIPGLRTSRMFEGLQVMLTRVLPWFSHSHIAVIRK